MCTVSWCRPEPGRYALFFNRDERKTRLPAEPPTIRQTDRGTTFLSPADGDHGGTWLLANQHGLSVGLLNHYSAGEYFSPDHPTSRGHLVLSMADAQTTAGVANAIGAIDPPSFRPFLLFAVGPADEKLWIWDGEKIRAPQPRLPLTTSSFKQEEVTAARRQQFSSLGGSPGVEQLASFHDWHDPNRPEFSVRMRRSDTQTVSLSRVSVSPESVDFFYRPEIGESLTLAETITASTARIPSTR